MAKRKTERRKFTGALTEPIDTGFRGLPLVASEARCDALLREHLAKLFTARFEKMNDLARHYGFNSTSPNTFFLVALQLAIDFGIPGFQDQFAEIPRGRGRPSKARVKLQGEMIDDPASLLSFVEDAKRVAEAFATKYGGKTFSDRQIAETLVVTHNPELGKLSRKSDRDKAIKTLENRISAARTSARRKAKNQVV